MMDFTVKDIAYQALTNSELVGHLTLRKAQLDSSLNFFGLDSGQFLVGRLSEWNAVVRFRIDLAADDR